MIQKLRAQGWLKEFILYLYFRIILIHKKILSNSKQVGDDLGDQWFGYFLAK